jgi:protein TonB
MKPPTNNNELGVFGTVGNVSDSSWISSLVRQIRELREERKHPRPPLEITAQRDPSALGKFIETPSPISSLLATLRGIREDKRNPHRLETSAVPVEVEEIWSKHDTRVPGLLSLLTHAGVVTLLLIPWATSSPPPKVNETAVLVYTPTSPLILNLPKTADTSGGGGGGGKNQLRPPSKGQPPRGADKQIVPPTNEVKNPAPDLVVEQTVVAPQLQNMPQLSLLQIGDPLGVPGPPSSGPGQGGGIGSGTGRGVGTGDGPGVGPGSGGGIGGGTFRVGGGVSAPTILTRVEPQYSEEARKARYQGTVVLEAIVRRDGTVDIVRVVRSLGFGLDENAIRALKQWRFRPGMMNGQPVDISLNIEVNFNLR